MFDSFGPRQLNPFVLGFAVLLLGCIGASGALSQGPPSCTQVPNGSGGIRIFNCFLEVDRNPDAAAISYSVCIRRSASPPVAGEVLEIEVDQNLTYSGIHPTCITGSKAKFTWVTSSPGDCQIEIGNGPCQLFRFDAMVTNSSSLSTASIAARRFAAGANPVNDPPFGCHEDQDPIGMGSIQTADLCVYSDLCTRDFCTTGASAAPNLCRDDLAPIFAGSFETGDTSKWDNTVGSNPETRSADTGSG